MDVGGDGGLAMAELRRACAEAGLRNVSTYVARGDLVFGADLAAAAAEAPLTSRNWNSVRTLSETAAALG